MSRLGLFRLLKIHVLVAVRGMQLLVHWVHAGRWNLGLTYPDSSFCFLNHMMAAVRVTIDKFQMVHVDIM